MLTARRREQAFHPAGRMEILPTERDVMCILRISPDNTEYVLAFISVNPGLTTVEIPINLLPKPLKTNYTELIRGNSFSAALTRNSLQFQLTGFGVYWLK